MKYSITIDKFEGPLDLLLHLIKKNDINIFDINIADITEHYLDYIREMDKLKLDISSEYLVMAADLILMKSKELLPTYDEEEDEEKVEFINRLAEYQRYKEASETFKDLENLRNESFTKPASFLEEFKTDEVNLSADLTIDDLLKALAQFNAKKELEKPLNTVVTRKEYSVERRSKEIMSVLKNKKVVPFEDLFDRYTRDYIVVTFLSILDLAKKGSLLIRQNYNRDKIILEAKEVRVWL